MKTGGKNCSFGQNFKNSYLLNSLYTIEQSISEKLNLGSIIENGKFWTIIFTSIFGQTAYDVIKWKNVQKLCINTLALSYIASDETCSFVYLIYLNLFEDNFWWRDLGVSTASRD